MIAGLCILFGLSLAGEALALLCGLPLPGAVPGLVGLTLWLLTRPAIPSQLAGAADALHAEMGVLFVPAGAAIITQGPALAAHGGGYLLVLLLGTLAAFLATGLAWQVVAARRMPQEATP